MSTKRIWVLGAADPEMAAIEMLLQEAGENFTHATVGGVRVHPGNVYKADPVQSVSAHDEMILVECGFSAPTEPVPEKVVKIDHHRPGDSGYGRPPLEYWWASSLGQVFSFLTQLEAVSFQNREIEKIFEVADRVCEVPEAIVESLSADGHDDLAERVENLLMAAAADHCLEAAYHGRCPGVDPADLMVWRVEVRARHQGRHPADILMDVEKARAKLRKATEPCPACIHYGGYCGGMSGHPACGTFSGGVAVGPEYADLRGQQVPELPEAAAREGIPFLSTVRDRDGREKIVLQAAPPELIKRFLAGEIVQGLQDFYGDPARGFAGGYTKPKQG